VADAEIGKGYAWMAAKQRSEASDICLLHSLCACSTTHSLPLVERMSSTFAIHSNPLPEPSLTCDTPARCGRRERVAPPLPRGTQTARTAQGQRR